MLHFSDPIRIGEPQGELAEQIKLVKGKTFQEVAMFVAKQLAPMEYVISTATHFILRRYKELDVELMGNSDDRETMSL